MVENVLNRPDEVGLTESFLNETCLQNPYVGSFGAIGLNLLSLSLSCLVVLRSSE